MIRCDQSIVGVSNALSLYYLLVYLLTRSETLQLFNKSAVNNLQQIK